MPALGQSRRPFVGALQRHAGVMTTGSWRQSG